jgi:hypothetical protein
MHVSQLHCHCATVFDEKCIDFVLPNKQVLKNLNKKIPKTVTSVTALGLMWVFVLKMAL